jgi:branched-chain amino acid transport system permease protein
MILLGGLSSLSGPIVGALAYTAIGEVAQLLTERKLLVEGLVILIVVLSMPKGLSGIRLPRWRPDWLRQNPAQTPPQPARTPEVGRHG